MKIFGLGQFAQVMAKLVHHDGFTVHRKYVGYSTAMPFEDLQPIHLLLAVGYSNLNKDREGIFSGQDKVGIDIGCFIYCEA